MKKVGNILIILFLIFGLFLQQITFVKAVSSESVNYDIFSPELKVLEIVDQGGSNLTNVLDSTLFDVKVMPMKKFVASREKLDGAYDLIAITDGGYSPIGVKNESDIKKRVKAHDTSSVMNDITHLKAREIINDFIRKDQLVILEKNSINNDRIENGKLIEGKLQKEFGSYINNPTKNVIVYDMEEFLYNADGSFNEDFDKRSDEKLKSRIDAFFKSDEFKERPRFTLVKEPIKNPEEKYNPEDRIEFHLAIQKPKEITKSYLKAYLYIDADFNDRFEPSEIVAEQDVQNDKPVISYLLPHGYSGIRNWKLEVVDMGTNLKDYQQGTFYFKDQEVKVNVLQVLQNSDKTSALTASNNMDPTYLKKDGEYNIHIDVTDMDQFNRGIHDQINGKYDMVIFGFEDVYNSAPISDTAAKAVQNYIATKQSVMFTHDTIFGDGNNWVDYFMDATGQKTPQTNLGLGAPNISTTTKKVNDGLITDYPNNLGEYVTVNPTHNQYYTLDLEDENVIPWYNIIGSNRDENDSWNHYYTYSKGNVTYSGTGHTNTNFPQDEQRLFVNTMYRAIIGSNHAPMIAVNTPVEENGIPTYQNIELSYKLQDYDLQDRKLNTTVYLNDQIVFEQKGVANGSTIVQSIPHGLKGNGQVTLKIDVEDERGAKAEKLMKLNIVKIDAGLKVTRTISNNNIIPINSPIDISYHVEPFLLTEAADKISPDVKEYNLRDVSYKESFPPYLDVQAPNGFERTGSLESGYTITKTYDTLTFKRNVDGVFEAPAKFDFTISVTPKKKSNYVLVDSMFSYKNMDGEVKTDTFNPLTIRTDIILDRVELYNAVINKGMSENLMTKLSLFPNELHKEDVTITWSESSNGSILTIDPNTGVVTAVNQGTAQVTAVVTDAFGNKREATCNVTVRTPIKSIALNDMTIQVGEEQDLQLTVDPVEAKSSVNVSINRNEIADVNGFKVKGLAPGQTEITVTGIDADGKLITAKAMLTVEKRKVTDIFVSPNVVQIDKNQTFSHFTVTIQPSNATDKTLEWKSLNPDIVGVLENGIIIGNAAGEGLIEISSQDGPKAYVTVKVGSPLKGISGSNFTIEKGDNSKNIANYYVKVPIDATNVSKEPPVYVASNPYFVEVSPDGTIIPKRIGEAIITVTVKDENGKPFTTSMKVNIVEKGDVDHQSTSKW